MSILNSPKHLIMKAFIIYQDFASGTKAKLALLHSTKYLGTSVEWSISPWRIDMLKFPSMAEEAVLDAVDAHLIVFAGQYPNSSPIWLRDWLEQWARQRQIKDVALAVINGEDAGDPFNMATQELSQFAKRHELSFIFDDQDLLESSLEIAPPPFADMKPELLALLMGHRDTVRRYPVPIGL
jgi:hypothetical protein